MYADDILLLSPSISALQSMLNVCETQLACLDMALNARKSVCVRIGSRHKDDCCSLVTLSGETLCWVDQCRYLGVFILSAKKFKRFINNNKKQFFEL